MKNLLYILILFSITISCKKDNQPNAQSIVDKAIEVTGGEAFAASTISFDFRDKSYKAIRNNGVYQFEREFVDSTNTIKDVLSNNGFQRYINETPFTVHDTMVPKYSRSVNSVHYFSVLPYGLNDAAVTKSYLNDVSIKGKTYHKIKVSFSQDGGGDDFEDVFVYWIDKISFKVDYLAYSYQDNSPTKIGYRFREAYNERYINGLRFVDYNNYKPKNSITNLLSLDKLFEADKLKLLSKIENKNIEVNY